MSDITSIQLESLLRAARQHDPDAIESLVRFYSSKIRDLSAASMDQHIATKVDASDVAQQSIIEMARDLPYFRGRTQRELLIWLRRITRNNAHDAQRRFRETAGRDISREVMLGSGQDLPSLEKTPSSHARRAERDEELWEAIQRLPIQQRRVVELRHRDGLSHFEIAKELGITEISSRQLYSRGIRGLRDLLADLDGQAGSGSRQSEGRDSK